jgi:hypothetical protein
MKGVSCCSTGPFPFEVSAEVNEWLSKIPSLANREPGFSWVPRYGKYAGDKLKEEFVGDHYVITHASVDAWHSAQAIQVMIGARRFWVPADMLDKLRGKTLSVIRSNVSKQDGPEIRTFLVAS